MTTSDTGSPPPSPPPSPPLGKGTPMGIAGAIDGDLAPCRVCGRSVVARALFCHSCGAVQPPRAVDHFTRLGLERRFDIDLEQLNRQYTGFSRALAPERFAARGAGQQANARAQAEALSAAFEALRDPVRRARYLLDLTGAPATADAGQHDEEVADLSAHLSAASDVAAVDRLAADLGQRIEACIKYLAIAFRNGQTDNAARLLARLERLEALCAEARARRAGLAAPGP